MIKNKSHADKLAFKFITYTSNGKPWVSELIKILGFGLLSLLLGKIKFYLPGVGGVVSDLREIGLIIGVFYFKRWYSIIPISLLTSLGTPPEGSVIATVVMHIVALLIIYYVFKLLNKRINNRFYLIGAWLVTGVFYFGLFLIPTMVVAYYFVGIIDLNELVDSYLKIMGMAKFEITATTAVTSLFLLNIKTTEILENRNRELLASSKKSEESEKLKSAFLQNLSHEIRTPMNGIQGFSRLLQNLTDPDDDIQQYTKQIIKSGDQLLAIVNDIIDASQIETRQISPEFSSTTIHTVVAEIIENFNFRQDINAARIIFNRESVEDVTFRTDVYKFTRALYHLVDNAIKFSDEMPVELDYKVKSRAIEFSVKDYGVGIAPENEVIIFESFRQIDSDLTRKYGGNGLGLTIALGFIESLQGKIWFTSELGKGSVFYFSVPIL